MWASFNKIYLQATNMTSVCFGFCFCLEREIHIYQKGPGHVVGWVGGLGVWGMHLCLHVSYNPSLFSTLDLNLLKVLLSESIVSYHSYLEFFVSHLGHYILGPILVSFEKFQWSFQCHLNSSEKKTLSLNLMKEATFTLFWQAGIQATSWANLVRHVLIEHENTIFSIFPKG